MSKRNGDKSRFGRLRKQKIQHRARTRALFAAAGESAAGAYSFACADAGNAQCAWRGKSREPEELMEKVRSHARNRHGIHSFTPEQQQKIRERFKTAS